MSDLYVNLEAPNGVKYRQPTGLFINNEFVPGSSTQKITSIDPATEKEIATVHAANADDVDKAVKAAYDAFHSPSWKKLPPPQRGVLMNKLADYIEERTKIFATSEAWDNGKVYTDAEGGDVVEVINTIRYYAGWADKITGQTITANPNKLAYTLRQPLGVVAQIIPWNYPLAMAAWKIGPALACGNTIVMKAAEQTPLSILLLGEAIKAVGFPPGVFNALNGYGSEAGPALVEHPLVDKVAFTGSTATGARIMEMASKTLKNITLETGGKSPLLVFSDSDLDEAVKWSHMGIMSNQGQICTATSRLLVQDKVYDEFVQRFIETTKTVSKVGHQWDSETYQGPQVSKQQYDRILEYIQIGKSEGATLLAGGQPVDSSKKGFFIQPTVFGDVHHQMRVFREEIFGPVVVITKFSDEAEALKLANDTTYGLGAAVFTKDVERAHRVAAEIEAGMVWINSTQDSEPYIPFGGVKQSGIGRELGEAGLEAYSNTKSIHVNLGSRLVKVERVDSVIKTSAGLPQAALKNRHLFDLKHPTAAEFPTFPYHAEVATRRALCSFGVSYFRSGSILRQKKGFRFDRAVKGTERKLEPRSVLFEASSSRSKGVGYEWRDAQGELIAREVEDERTSMSLVITAEMSVELRDALVAAWILRIWYELSKGNNSATRLMKVGGRQQNLLYLYAGLADSRS
ncbi:putative aldehyde dehydrogenase-like protein [Fusarium culmorum]|uniref:Putative aldehyde dehydrogenase-like protein n=1 Tax=Fusarium culmorum TaxID=5516 RepID=A0A2T4GSJ8_FUSCU|nr:putative aldehyde dehydrogenase-like protein [Fusarium culmorum]